MHGPVDLGIPGVAFEPGDHVCALYLGPAERDEVMVPYLRAGLRDGDRCIAVVDTSAPADLVASVRAGSRREAGLDVRTADETYLRSGEFAAEGMIDFWEEYLEGQGFLRATGEMSWAFRNPGGLDELVRYEAGLNRLSERRSSCLLCLYDLRLFSGRILLDLLRTHPKVLFGGSLFENPLYAE